MPTKTYSTSRASGGGATQDLSPYMKLDQTTPQTMVGTFIFPGISSDTITFYNISGVIKGTAGVLAGEAGLDDLSNVQITGGPFENQTLIWNGSNFVNAASGTVFTFNTTTFDDGQSSPQLIGAGTWKSAGGITFTATYANGPPTGATITMAGGSSNWSPLAMDYPYASKVSTGAAMYPASLGGTITFTLTALKGGVVGALRTATVTFYNKIYYGVSTKTSSFVSGDLIALTNQPITNSYTGNISNTINSTAGNYVIFTHPTAYTALHPSGLLFNGVTCLFSSYSINVTNISGFNQNYYVYCSHKSGLGSSTLTTSTTSNTINNIWYGVSTTGSSFTAAAITGLTSTGPSNIPTRTIYPVAAANQYVVYALPVRLGTVSFWVGGFKGGFNDTPEVVWIINVNGHQEPYNVYASINMGLNLSAGLEVRQP